MKIADALAYAPVVTTAVTDDGRFVILGVPRYDPSDGSKRPRLFLLDLDTRQPAWREITPADSNDHGAHPLPGSHRAVVYREEAGVTSLVVVDLTDPGAVTPPLVGAPTGTALVKPWPATGAVGCVGFDADGTRRLWVWSDVAQAPVAVTPSRLRVADWSASPDRSVAAWLHIPPRQIGAPAPKHLLFVGQAGMWSEVEAPENVLGFLAWSPDGRHLAVLARPQDEVLTQPRLWVWARETGRWSRLLEGHDGWITGLDWDGPDGIVVAVEQGIEGRLLRAGLDGAVQRIGAGLGFVSAPHVAKENGRLVALAQDVHEPQHARLWMPGEAGDGRKISRFNGRLDALDRRPAERFAWTAPDGLALEGLLVRPAGDGPHPMIVWLHGGPAEHLQRTFSAYFQVFAAAGYAVFAPNVRGSTGRDDAFLRAVVGDLCGADVADVESGVRRLIVAGVAHRRRVSLLGWSYGGSLALSVAAQAKWVRCVVAGAPVADWLTVFGARSWPAVTRAYFPGETWEDPASYDRCSPARRLGTMNAPTLLLHGEGDDRVPVSQSRFVYHTLLARGVPTDLRVFGGEGHVFSAPWAVQEFLARTLAWVGTHAVD